jgi:hypothetical protein
LPYAVALQVSQVCDVRCSNAVSSLTGHQLEKQTSRGIGLRFFRGFQPANVKDTTDPAMWLAITKLGTSEIMRDKWTILPWSQRIFALLGILSVLPLFCTSALLRNIFCAAWLR